MTSHTKRTLDAAVDELKREGYMVLMIMLDQKADEQQKMGNAVEVLCSHTNDPKIVSSMLKETLQSLTSPVAADRLN